MGALVSFGPLAGCLFGGEVMCWAGVGGVDAVVGGPFKVACSGVKKNEFQPSSSPRKLKRLLFRTNR